MASTKYYWTDEGSTFGGGESPTRAGDSMPDGFEKDERFESFKKSGLISTEKKTTNRQLSELEQLRKEVSELKQSGGGKADPKAVQTALETSTQADLNKIAYLEGDLELIKEGLGEIKPALSKEDILAKVKEIKDLIKGE